MPEIKYPEQLDLSLNTTEEKVTAKEWDPVLQAVRRYQDAVRRVPLPEFPAVPAGQPRAPQAVGGGEQRIGVGNRPLQDLQERLDRWAMDILAAPPRRHAQIRLYAGDAPLLELNILPPPIMEIDVPIMEIDVPNLPIFRLADDPPN